MKNAKKPVKQNQTQRQCAANILAQLNLGYDVNNGQPVVVPPTGPVLVTANCPYSANESIALLHLLLKHRADVKILGDRQLEQVEGLAQNIIAPLRSALSWLANGGLLIVFPAGGGNITDISRLARKTEASVLPVYIESPAPLTGQLFSPDKKLHIWLGKPIAAARLKRFGNEDETARYLRLHSHMLISAKHQKLQRAGIDPAPEPRYEEIISPIPRSYLALEVKQLGPEQKLATSANIGVYLARSEQIPHALREIGRLREITFREVGEGTGKAIDIDLHDRFYLHLFLWDRDKNRIAGAYRLGLSDQIIRQHGKKGLYTQTLFKLHTRFLQSLSPAIELGRSFICREYQKTIMPLLLLWKGIGAFIVRNPQYSTLFGPVSISNDYCPASRQLLIDYLKIGSFDDPLRKFIKARHPYRGKTRPIWHKYDLANIGSFEALSDLVSLLEGDGKGAPVLLRHYVNIGGRMLDFNVDQSFGNCVDGLVVVDLCKTDDRILSRYLGAPGLERFKQYHDRTLVMTA